MKRTISKDCSTMVGKKVLLKGWMNQLRELGKINFLILRDRGGYIQVVIEDKAEIKKLSGLYVGTVLQIEGTVQEAKQTELGAEIIEPKITVLSPVKEALPVEYNKDEIHAELPTILDHRPITLRNKKIAAVFTIQAKIIEGYRKFLLENGFTEYFGPNIIGASSEGGAELFNVDYFGNDAKLSQSSQLYKQMMVGVYERVFALMKCFRAEKSNTSRHVTEATQCEFEIGFVDNINEIFDWEEKVIRAIVSFVSDECIDELKLFENVAELPENVKIPRVTLKEAQEIFFKRTKEDIRGEDDLIPAAEKELSVYAKEEFGCDFIFVTHFPRSKTAFYAKHSKEDRSLADYGDLLCNGAEVSSGGLRIDNYEELVESLKEKELDPKDFEDYLSIFKYGMPAHGGFGLGFERFTQQFLGISNIREAILFPSDMQRIASARISGVESEE